MSPPADSRVTSRQQGNNLAHKDAGEELRLWRTRKQMIRDLLKPQLDLQRHDDVTRLRARKRLRSVFARQSAHAGARSMII